MQHISIHDWNNDDRVFFLPFLDKCQDDSISEPDRLKLTVPIASLLLMKDKELTELFTFRTKNDLIIRRLFLKDILKVYANTKVTSLVLYNTHLNYIATANLLIYANTYPNTFECLLSAIPRAFYNFQNFSATMKNINKFAKTSSAPIEKLLHIMELVSLLGYRIPPVPDFDENVAAKALVDFPIPCRTQGWFGKFQDVASELLNNLQAKEVEYLTFNDYIQQCSWVTSGSSSDYRASISLKGEKAKSIKSKKNMVPFLASTADLIELCLLSNGEVNTVIVKAELAKCRIAVCSDLANYLMCSWLTYLSGHDYVHVSASTLEYDEFQMLEYNKSILPIIINNYSLPFDYENFDHQVTLQEQDIIVRTWLSNVATKYSNSEVPFYINKVLHNMNNATLILSNKSEIKVVKGLRSGSRWTSLIGNLFNIIASTIITDESNLTNKILLLMVRGDDTSITSIYKVDLDKILSVYKDNYLKFSEGKFSIQFRRTEFLRIWYTTDGLLGLPVRSVPGMVQQKPWNNSPHSIRQKISDILSSIFTFSRRSQSSLEKLIQSASRVFSRLSSQSIKLLSTPKYAGGLGLLPTKYLYTSSPYKEPFDIVEDVRILNKQPTNDTIMFIKSKILVTESVNYDLSKMEKDYMLDVLNSDTIPISRSLLSKSKIVGTRPVFFKALSSFKRSMHTAVHLRDLTLQLYLPIKRLRLVRYLDPKTKAIIDQRRYCIGGPFVDKSIFDILTQLNPEAKYKMLSLEKRYSLHRAESFDIINGSYPTLALHGLNSFIEAYLDSIVWNYTLDPINQLGFKSRSQLHVWLAYAKAALVSNIRINEDYLLFYRQI